MRKKINKVLKIGFNIVKNESNRKKILTGDWERGIITPNNELFVTSEIFHNELAYLAGYGDIDIMGEGGARIVHRNFKLAVDVYNVFYQKIRDLMKEFIPFYRYVNIIEFEIFDRYKYRYEEIKLSGDESGFSLLENYKRVR